MSFTCHCGNTGVQRTPNNSQHTQLTLNKKIVQPLLPGFELATFRSRVRRSIQQATPKYTCQVNELFAYVLCARESFSVNLPHDIQSPRSYRRTIVASNFAVKCVADLSVHSSRYGFAIKMNVQFRQGFKPYLLFYSGLVHERLRVCQVYSNERPCVQQ